MFLEDIPGQNNIKSYLNKIIREKRFPHAMLILGEQGSGILPFALSIASALECSDPKEGIACQICPSCLKSKQFIHPDIHFSFPVIKKDNLKRDETTSKDFMSEWRSFLDQNPYGDINDWLAHLNATDKTANINVAECNNIIKNLSLKTYEGPYKVQIVWCAEMLGKEGNRLLKLIEEPTDNTVILLLSNNRNAILNTIRSRCQILAVPPFEDDAVKSLILEESELNGDLLDEVIYLSAGDMRKAKAMALRADKAYSEELLNWLRAAYSGDPEMITNWVDNMASGGKQQLKTFFQYGLHFFREFLLALNSRETDKLKLSSAEKNAVLKMTKIIDYDKTVAIEQLLNKCIVHIGRNLSIKILLMHMSLEINKILRSEVNKFAT